MDNQDVSLEFIEIKRVVSDDTTKMNVASHRECIPVAEIQSFRAWHKGPNDVYIKGEMTFVLLRPKKKKEERVATVGDNGKVEERVKGNGEKPRSMLIEESYTSFLNRMSHYVPVRPLPPEEADMYSVGGKPQTT